MTYSVLERLRIDTIIGFASVLIRFINPYSDGHENRVADMSIRLAHKLRLSASEIEIISDAAQLHDVGKLLLDDSLINKAQKFTYVELSKVQQHVIYGVRILTALLINPKIISVVHSHHERWDGAGYPNKLMENEIPIGSQIISIADSYDAMTSVRGYKSAMTHEQAMLELEAGRGKQYSPEVLDAFIEMQ